MAANSENVFNLLNELLTSYKPTALKEVDAVQRYASQEQGEDFVLMPWDWSFYSSKLKKEKFVCLQISNLN